MTGTGRGGKTVPLGYQEPISCDAECGVMMKSAPASPFIMTETQFLLQFLVVPLNNPAVFGDLYQILQLRLRRKGRQPVFSRL